MAPMFRMPIPMEFPYPCSRGLEISSSSQLFLSLLQNHKRMKGFSLLPDLQLLANWSLLVILAHPVSLKAE
jgi:hypothetical protein